MVKKGVTIPKAGHKSITYCCFSNLDKDSFPLDVSNSILSGVYNFIEPDAAVHYWHSVFVSVYNKHAPFKTKRVKHSAKPKWLTQDIQDAIHYRDRLLKSGNHDEYKKQRNTVTSLLHASKKKYFQDLATCKQNSKSIWKGINQLTSKTAACNSFFFLKTYPPTNLTITCLPLLRK